MNKQILKQVFCLCTLKWVVGVILVLAVIHSVATFVLGRQVENEIGKIKASGNPVSFVELAGKPIPDSENGALIYEKVFTRIKDLCGQNTDYNDILIPKNRNNTAAWIKAREAINKHADVFPLVEQAAAMPKCRFKTNWQDGPGTLFPYYKDARELSRLLAVKAIVEAKDGNADQALKFIRMIYNVSDSIKDDPTIISVMVRLYILKIADNTLQNAANYISINSAQAKKLITIISQENLRACLVNGINGEMAEGIGIFDLVKRQSTKQVFSNDERLLKFEISYLARPLLYLDEKYFIQQMNKYIKMAYNFSDQQNFLNNKTTTINKYYAVSNILFPEYGKIFIDNVNGQTILNGSQLFVALCAYKHQFGSYPKTLAELRSKTKLSLPTQDPFSKRDFIYKQKENGFLLYSIGENMKDNGGNVDNLHSADGDIVWKLDH